MPLSRTSLGQNALEPDVERSQRELGDVTNVRETGLPVSDVLDHNAPEVVLLAVRALVIALLGELSDLLETSKNVVLEGHLLRWCLRHKFRLRSSSMIAALDCALINDISTFNEYESTVRSDAAM